MTKFKQCLVLILIRNHELSVTQVIGRNDDHQNLEDRALFVRYCILQLSPLGSVMKHLWYNITNAIEECEECSITIYISRGYNIRTYKRAEQYYCRICVQSRLQSSKQLVCSMRLQNNRSKARMLEQRNYYAIRGM